MSTSGVVDLPTEVLQLIFSEHLAQLPTYLRLRLAPLTPPLIFMHVCRRWREVANGFSDLWKALDLKLPRSTFEDKRVCTSIAHLLEGKHGWICDIKVVRESLYHPTVGGRSTLRVLRKVLAPILHPGTALTTLRLDRVTLGELDRLSSGLFSSLRSLTLNMYEVSSNEVKYTCEKERVGGAGPLRVFEGMSELRTLKLSRQAIECLGEMTMYTPHSYGKCVKLPWNQLIRIEDTGLGGTKGLVSEEGHLHHEAFLQVCLSQCQNLESLKLTVSTSDMKYQWNFRDLVSLYPPRVLTKLKSLTLDYTDSRSNDAVSDTRFQALFAFPNLRNLTLIAPRTTSVSETFLLHLRSLKAVEYLDLDLCGTYETIHAYFSSFPSVKTLSVNHNAKVCCGSRYLGKAECMGQLCPLEVLAHTADAYALRPLPLLETLIVDWDVPKRAQRSQSHSYGLIKLTMATIQSTASPVQWQPGFQRGNSGSWFRRIVLRSRDEWKVRAEARRLVAMETFEGRFEVLCEVKEDVLSDRGCDGCD